MEGIAEAIEQIRDLAVEAAGVKIVSTPEPTGEYIVVKPDGSTERIIPSPKYHSERLDTPAEIAKFIEELPDIDGETMTFMDESRIVVVYDREDRRDRATCKLIPSPQFQWLRDFGGKQLTQADVVRNLRIVFRGCLADANVLPFFRNLKFNQTNDGGANLQHGKESIGRSIEAKVTGTDATPEEIAFVIPVFDNHPFRARVAVAVEVSVMNQTFALTPFPQELKNATEAAFTDIVETLTADDAPTVYRGSPE